MNYPSIKTLQAITDSPEQAKRLRAVLTAKNREEVCQMSEQAAKYRVQCYHEPEFYLLKMYAANEIMGGYGVEGQDIPAGYWANCQTPPVWFEYVNLGETYATTLVRLSRHGKVTYRVTDWGTIIERYDRQSKTA